MNLKPIETVYKGYRFRSRLEARWAVFFDACGVDWEYEPEGFDLGGGLMYLPDFLLHGVQGRDGGDLYVEVKGNMTQADVRKINRFARIRMDNGENGVFVVGRIPEGDDVDEIICNTSDMAYSDSSDINVFNFETVDGDYFAAHPGVNLDGGFELFGDDSSYLADMDPIKTERAFRAARQARFEHVERPRY